MARLRPARTMRTPNSQAWARYSLRRPKKNYVRAMPSKKLLIFNMGKRKPDYDLTVTLNAKQPIQLRANALEASRMVANKYMEINVPENYFFKVLVYPHNVIREHKMASGAGADRISRGMSLAFGRPVSLAARLREGQAVFMIKTQKQHREIAVHAMKRAASKLSGLYKITAV